MNWKLLKARTIEGFVVKKNGKYFGRVSPDGPMWIEDISNASLHDPVFAKQPSDCIQPNMGHEMNGAVFIKARMTLIFDIEEEDA